MTLSEDGLRIKLVMRVQAALTILLTTAKPGGKTTPLSADEPKPEVMGVKSIALAGGYRRWKMFILNRDGKGDPLNNRGIANLRLIVNHPDFPQRHRSRVTAADDAHRGIRRR